VFDAESVTGQSVSLVLLVSFLGQCGHRQLLLWLYSVNHKDTWSHEEYVMEAVCVIAASAFHRSNSWL
jgi:hypothetical protein